MEFPCTRPCRTRSMRPKAPGGSATRFARHAAACHGARLGGHVEVKWGARTLRRWRRDVGGGTLRRGEKRPCSPACPNQSFSCGTQPPNPHPLRLKAILLSGVSFAACREETGERSIVMCPPARPPNGRVVSALASVTRPQFRVGRSSRSVRRTRTVCRARMYLMSIYSECWSCILYQYASRINQPMLKNRVSLSDSHLHGRGSRPHKWRHTSFVV